MMKRFQVSMTENIMQELKLTFIRRHPLIKKQLLILVRGCYNERKKLNNTSKIKLSRNTVAKFGSSSVAFFLNSCYLKI